MLKDNKDGEKVTNPYRTMSFCLGCLSCSASSSSLFMTLVASELPEVPSDLSPAVDFDKRRGSWWPENRTEEKILHIRKSRVSHNIESSVEINVTVHRYYPNLNYIYQKDYIVFNSNFMDHPPSPFGLFLLNSTI